MPIMIQTIIVDVVNEKTMKLLQGMDLLQLFRMRNEKTLPMDAKWATRYKGAMSNCTNCGTDGSELALGYQYCYLFSAAALGKIFLTMCR